MRELDESDQLLAISIIDAYGERLKERGMRNGRIHSQLNIGLMFPVILCALKGWWTAYFVLFTLQSLTIVSLIIGYRKIEREEEQWLVEHLPSWCRDFHKRPLEK